MLPISMIRIAKLNVKALMYHNMLNSSRWCNIHLMQELSRGDLSLFPDVKYATVEMSGEMMDVYKAVGDDRWLMGDFVQTVQLRHITAMGDPSDLWSLSMAVAAGDHMKSLWCGLPDDSWTCMGVMSDGSYEVPEGIFFSFPVRVRDRKWSIVQARINNESVKREREIVQRQLLFAVNKRFCVSVNGISKVKQS
uniref:Lactate/malate dehydrogenase C-terminal domain-containing protein n=1 Tax=Timema shepardi TaxID=629360 RepID=A0A7R9FXA2_TIMSH|nr:unnamed protein product [Timema shepardi]